MPTTGTYYQTIVATSTTGLVVDTYTLSVVISDCFANFTPPPLQINNRGVNSAAAHVISTYTINFDGAVISQSWIATCGSTATLSLTVDSGSWISIDTSSGQALVLSIDQSTWGFAEPYTITITSSNNFLLASYDSSVTPRNCVTSLHNGSIDSNPMVPEAVYNGSIEMYAIYLNLGWYSWTNLECDTVGGPYTISSDDMPNWMSISSTSNDLLGDYWTLEISNCPGPFPLTQAITIKVTTDNGTLLDIYPMTFNVRSDCGTMHNGLAYNMADSLITLKLSKSLTSYDYDIGTFALTSGSPCGNSIDSIEF